MDTAETGSGPELALVALDRIVPSATNPRRTFDETALAQLAESIRTKGVIEHVLYKTREAAEAGAPRYELVAGERRFRASRLAGAKVIPAIVRTLDDRSAIELQVIENDQREDVPPLEQADGYARLVSMGDDAESIAAKIGRPAKYVVNRLQLTHLVPQLAEDLRAGKLPFGHAHLLARLPADDQRWFVEKQSYGSGTPLYDFSGHVIPLDRLRKTIKEGFLGCLSAAPWKKDDESLVPAAGACSKCPKRSGSNPTLFDELLNGDAKKGRDFCTDRGCYTKKQETFVELQVKLAAAQNAGTALKLTTDYYSRDPDVLAADRYEIATKKEQKSAKAGELTTAVVVAGRERGELGKIVQVRLKKEPKARAGGADSFSREQAARKKRAEAGRAAALKANGIVAAKVELLWRCLDSSPTGILPALRQLAAELAEITWSDACRQVAKRRKLPSNDHALVAAVAHNSDSAAELFGLIAELIAARKSFEWGGMYYADNATADVPFWSTFGVDQKKLLKEAQESKADKPSKVKPAKKAKGRKAVAR